MTKLETALKYASMGWHVFPCHSIVDGACSCTKECNSPGKHPISELAPQGQKNATTDKDIITDWWTKEPNANIAIFLAGSGLCAVDIDPRNGGDYTIEDLEAVHGEILSNVVQLTGGGGEHRVFLRPEGDLVGKLGKGVDLKLNGYIIAEPSNHISGGEYIWEASSNPLDGCVASPLPDWIRSFEKLNQAEATNTALHAGMDDDQYYDALEALPFINNDDRDTWLTVGMALHATNDRRAYIMWCDWSASSEKYDQRDQYRVWRSFRHKGMASIDLPTLFQMAQEAGWINNKNKTSSGNDDVVKLEKKNDFNDVPKHLLNTPVDTLNKIASWMESHAREPQRQITIQGVLALASVLCGRMYQSTEGNTSSMYFMVLGDTGVGKNYIKVAIQQFLANASLDDLLSGGGNTSSGAVFTALKLSPCHIQIMDEIGKHLQTARKQRNGQIAEGFATLTEAYSSHTSIMISKNYSSMGSSAKDLKDNKTLVHCPAITTLGLATPGQVYDNLSTVEIEDGFLNRIVTVDISLPQGERVRRKRKRMLDSDLVEWAKSLRNTLPQSKTDLSFIDTAHDMRPNMKEVDFTDGALELFDAFYDWIKEAEDNGEFVLPDMTRRWNENAMRLATALAVCDNPAEPVINDEIAKWCIDYIGFYGNQFMERVATKVADSDFHRLYLIVVDLVERAGKKGMTERDLSKNSRLFASSTPVMREQAFKALLAEERIMQVSQSTASGRGRKRVSYIHPEYFDIQTMEDKTK